MNFSIPILIEERPAVGGQPTSFVVRPLFHSEPMQRSEKLGRALNRLSADLQGWLYRLGREPRHDRLADWALPPNFEETTVNVRLDLASGSHLKRFFLVGYEALGRRLFFTPNLPDLHFEVSGSQAVAERATTVFTRHFRELEKESEVFDLDVFALQGKARLTAIDITLKPAALAKKPQPPKRALLFGAEEKKEGEEELRRTGRLLQSLYPDDLDRAIGREREVDELARMLASTDRRPILLVGPRKVGKTTVLHELVWQMRTRKKERFAGQHEIWLLSPMRLISGMSFLGEWENRVLAILDYAREKDRVLYFDDLLGLLTAGMTCASDLNVAQVLRPALEKRSVRIIAEITPEAWRVLRERDRAFADLFQVIPIAEPTEPETLRVLVNVTRQLEEQYRCAFGLEVVPAVFDLHRRFAGDAAFPGKAAGFLRRLAVRHAHGAVERAEVLEEFRSQSGMSAALLDGRERLERSTILESLRAGLAGQDHAVEAFADVIVTLKARLNDPRRPLGTLLLLGPTGVGKTQSAKVLSQFLFGNADRLQRFDMNEYVDGASAGRLAGTVNEPEGLLTGAIRRQPFSVLLFDEIEKAAPEVFDLLLAVLDEGRLTDSLGRVADFTNAVILMTSNLGVRESRSSLGFGAGDQLEAADALFVGAAEKFFRPEFFNRLDRVIPFRPLATTQLESIARQLIADVFARDGLRRRECLLRVSPDAMKRLVELGQNPQLGARALKRVIEREVAQPIAERLAGVPPGTPTIANFDTREGALVLNLQELQPAPRSIFWPQIVGQSTAARLDAILDGANAALDRIEAALAEHEPKARIELGNLAPEQARYFACREQLKMLDRLIQAVENARRVPRRGATTARNPAAKPVRKAIWHYIGASAVLGRMRDQVALQHALEDWASQETTEVPDSPALALCRELALLEAMVQQPWDDRPVALVFQPLEERDAMFAFALAQMHFDFFNDIWGGSAKFLLEAITADDRFLQKLFKETNSKPTMALFLSGLNLRLLLPVASSPVLLRRSDGALGVALSHLHDADSFAAARAIAETYWPAKEEARLANQSIRGNVLQMLSQDRTLTDFRTGLVIPAKPSQEEFRALMLSALPLPPELAVLMPANPVA